jgi:hypothetical protein
VKNPFSPAASFKHIQAFLDNSRGQITIGEIPPIRRVTLAAEGKKARVALVCRDDETLADLLQRLDALLGKALAENTVIDEVLPEIKRRRSRSRHNRARFLCIPSAAITVSYSISSQSPFILLRLQSHENV